MTIGFIVGCVAGAAAMAFAVALVQASKRRAPTLWACCLTSTAADHAEWCNWELPPIEIQAPDWRLS